MGTRFLIRNLLQVMGPWNVDEFYSGTGFLIPSIYDVMTPENQGQLIRTYPSIKIPSMMGQQSTFYREVGPEW